MFLRLYTAIPALFLSLAVTAQKVKPYKFEKVDAAALSRKAYAIDSNAAAVVLADVGDTRIEGNNKGTFSFIFSRHRRVHILRQSGYDEASMRIPVYHKGPNGEETIESIKAIAYNLEDGKITETKMGKDAIFKEKISKTVDLYKFTLPAVREGTIIDIEYRLKSDYINTLQAWDFQEDIPVLRSEYTLAVPQFLDYLFIYKGYIPFAVNDQVDRADLFNVVDQTTTGPSERFSFRSGVTDHRWATVDVPAFRDENFMSARANYQAHIDFQLAGFRQPLNPHNFVRSWPEVTQDLLNDEQFGQKLDRDNPWLNETMRPLQLGSPGQQAQAIYAWVRDNITCSGTRGLYLQNSLKEVFRSGKGSVAEVNLLLVTMLRHAGLNANPVMLSTRDNGTVFTSFPMLTRFNYIIASVRVGEQTILLDASKPRLGFGRLLPDCYNGIAREVSTTADALTLLTDSLLEKDITMVFLPQKGGNWEGTYSSVPGYFNSYNLRRNLAEKGRDAFFAALRSGLGNNALVSNGAIDSLLHLEQPIGIRSEVKVPIGTDDLLYVNPMFGEGITENPFHAAERSYPVEMPYVTDRTFLLTMEVPDGYEVEELPKSVRVKLNEQNDAGFEYFISAADGVITLRTRVRFDRANYSPEEYEVLREFYTL
ncbi:MAG: DUF3857 domain-containing protein, partial [Sphingobacteriales bacterium]